MAEFVTLGEPLVVFCSTKPDLSIEDSTNFDKVVGGAELNVAVGMQRLGHQSEYIGQVGKDPQGNFIKQEISKKDIDISHLTETPDYLTGYQMKQLVTHGDPFVFNFRKNSAASHISSNFISSLDFNGVKAAHFTGIFAATSKTALETSKTFAKLMNEKGITLSFDTNLRPAMWPDQETMIKTTNELASYANIVLPGQSEGKILTGFDDPEEIADYYLKNENTQAVFVKVGAKGSYVKTKSGISALVPGFKVKKVVDTVGAGDGFALGAISALLEGKDYKQAAMRGNAVGALQVQTHGDNDGYPTREGLKKFYQENGVNE